MMNTMDVSSHKGKYSGHFTFYVTVSCCHFWCDDVVFDWNVNLFSVNSDAIIILREAMYWINH